MASLQELRKRLKSIRSTGQLAGAMRTAATAKYSRLGSVRGVFLPYAGACRDMLQMLGGSIVRREPEDAEVRDCVIVMGGNRGLCGGFNTELNRFVDEQLSGLRDPKILVCGRKAAAHLRERGMDFEEYPLSDVPMYEELRPLADHVLSLYTEGETQRILVIYQSFRNMLNQDPRMLQLLPETGEGGPAAAGDDSVLYFPDRETISEQLAIKCLNVRIYDLALENAVGAQAATMMAMRSACDNAEATAADLEITINRRRQADVTSSVIETASGNFSE